MEHRSPKQRYRLSDVYNAAKYDRHFDYAFWLHITLDIVGETLIGYAGYCLVVFATSLVTIISILGFFVVLPAVLTPGSILFVCHVLWGKLKMYRFANQFN